MTTRKNGHSPAKQASRQLAASVDPSGKIRLANKEKGFQQRIEKMQVAIVTKTVRLKKAVARGLKELVNARKMETLLEEHKVKPLSDYSHLKEIYETDLTGVTPEDLSREAEAKAEQFLTGGNKVSKEQERVVHDFYSLEAKGNQLGIEQVREFLIIKGQIKEAPADTKRMKEKEKIAMEDIAA
jgi:hypothetical protein